MAKEILYYGFLYVLVVVFSFCSFITSGVHNKTKNNKDIPLMVDVIYSILWPLVLLTLCIKGLEILWKETKKAIEYFIEKGKK